MVQKRPGPNGSPVKCDFPSYDCQTYFRRRYDMLRHKREYHQDPKKCPYPECLYTPKRLDRIIKHIDDTHTVTLNVPHDFNSHQTLDSQQQMHQETIYSGPANTVVVPENYSVQPGVGPPCFSNTWGSINDPDNTHPMSCAIVTEYPDQTKSYAAAMAKFDGPERFLSEAVQPAPLGMAGVTQPHEPDQETPSTIPKYGEEAKNHSSHNSRNEYTLRDPSSTSMVQAYPDVSTSSADFTTPYIHHPIHAAALSMDTCLYDPDYAFGL